MVFLECILWGRYVFLLFFLRGKVLLVILVISFSLRFECVCVCVCVCVWCVLVSLRLVRWPLSQS
jgi:hypothetical protein